MASAGGAERLAAINGLRGLAICAVIHHHLAGHFTPPGTGAVEIGGFTLFPLALLANGWLGVNLFFILSGFVLALPYEQGVRGLAGAADTRSFYFRRAARLLPLYYLVSLVTFAFNAPPAAQTPKNLLMLATLTFNFSEETFFPAHNWVLWSLGIEFWMSVCFPLLLLARRAVGAGGLFAAVAVLSLAVRFYGNAPEFQGANPLLNWVKDGPIARIDDFALGMFLAAVFVSRKGRPLDAGQSALALGVAFLAWLLVASGWDAVQLGFLDRAWNPLLNNLFQLACAAAVLGLLGAPPGLARSLFSNRPIQLLGMMCYSLYVWHGVLIVRAGLYQPGGFNAWNLALFAVSLAAISALTYRYVEFGHVRDARRLFVPER